MKKLLKNKFVLCSLSLLVFSSCMDDDQDYADPNKPVVTSDVMDTTIEEGESYTFTLNISRAISAQTDLKIEQISGNATEDDFTFDISELAEYELGPAGYQATIPGGKTSVMVTISTETDLETEGTKTGTFRIVQGQNGNALLPDGEIEFTLNIEDFDYCLWTLDGVDTYGDGWNGAAIRLTYRDRVIDYSVHDLDGEGPDIESFDIPVGRGDQYTFEFISGDFDGEVEYTLTAPDGTTFSDAYYPAAGVITSGTSSCN